MSNQDNAVAVPQQPASTGLSLFQKLRADGAASKPKFANVVEFGQQLEPYVAQKLVPLGDEIIQKYARLINTIIPADKGDTWRPALIAICSQKSTDRELIKRVGVGSLYVHESKKALPRDTLFFPLFTHVEHAWWVKEGGQWKTVCRSMDGVKGNRFSGDLQGQTVTCGSSSCPNTPDQFQKSTDQCKWGRALYLVDRDFSNIYQLPLKYFSVKETFDRMVKQTKQGGTKFVARAVPGQPVPTWFTLEAFEKGGDKGEGWYFRANATDAQLTPGEQEVIDAQVQGFTELYFRARVEARDRRGQAAASDMADLEAETNVTVNEEDGSSIVSM